MRSADAEDKFYRDLLSFKPYWHGGQTDARTAYDYTSLELGAIWLTIVFVGTLVHMQFKRRKAASAETYPDKRASEGNLKPQGLLEHR